MRWICGQAVKMYGMGPRSSALIAGYTHLHAELERKLALLTCKESCLLFPTGNTRPTLRFPETLSIRICSKYVVVIGVIRGWAGRHFLRCLEPRLDRRWMSFSNKESRTALDLQVLLSAIKCVESGFRHRDLHHLEQLLLECPIQNKLVITESLFSMDGDFADLQVWFVRCICCSQEPYRVWHHSEPSTDSSSLWMKRMRCLPLVTLEVVPASSSTSKTRSISKTVSFMHLASG